MRLYIYETTRLPLVLIETLESHSGFLNIPAVKLSFPIIIPVRLVVWVPGRECLMERSKNEEKKQNPGLSFLGFYS